MILYFLSDGRERLGPFKLEELKDRRVASQTLVWRRGMTEWTHVADVPELQSLLTIDDEPAPLPLKYAGDEQPPPLPVALNTAPGTVWWSLSRSSRVASHTPSLDGSLATPMG